MADSAKNKPAAVYLPDKAVPGQKAAPKKTMWLRIKALLRLLPKIILLLILVIGGFFLGIYLRIFDTNTINEKMELYKYPIIGDYFVKPDKPVKSEEIQQPEPVDKKVADVKISPDKALTADPSKPVVLTKEEIEKQMKLRQAEEKKRISKLARLYGQMKPKEAVDILDKLDDNMVVAILQKMEEPQMSKLLTTFDSERSAQLTKILYSGKPIISQIP
jgi:hypothetical protein